MKQGNITSQELIRLSWSPFLCVYSNLSLCISISFHSYYFLFTLCLINRTTVTLTYNTVQYKLRQDCTAVIGQFNYIWHHCEWTYHHNRFVSILQNSFPTHQAWSQKVTLQPTLWLYLFCHLAYRVRTLTEYCNIIQKLLLCLVTKLCSCTKDCQYTLQSTRYLPWCALPLFWNHARYKKNSIRMTVVVVVWMKVHK